jgi:hypothetical protein
MGAAYARLLREIASDQAQAAKPKRLVEIKGG